MPGDEQKPVAEKVLELNPNHPAFEALKNAFENDKEKAEKIAKVLHSSARLIAGLPVSDAVEYCDIICEFLK